MNYPGFTKYAGPLLFRRVNLYGGPGSGKSQTRADLFRLFKNTSLCGLAGRINFRVEEATEYVKEWAYDNRIPQGFDQNYIWAQQQKREERPLRAGVDLVISDSPLYLTSCFAQINNVPTAPELLTMTHKHEQIFPGIHILLNRGDRPYVAHGRFQTEAEAKAIDKHIEKYLKKNIPGRYMKLSPDDDIVTIFEYIMEKIKTGKDWKRI